MPKLPEFNRLADALRAACKTVAEGETYRAADVAAQAADMIEQFNAVGIEIVKDVVPEVNPAQLELPLAEDPIVVAPQVADTPPAAERPKRGKKSK